MKQIPEIELPRTKVYTLETPLYLSSRRGISYLPLSDLTSRLSEERDLGNSVTLTNGVFNLPHIGHKNHFDYSKLLEKEQGKKNTLIVAVNSDESVKALNRLSIQSFEERAGLLSGERSIDYICRIGPEGFGELLIEITPFVDFYTKGPDKFIDPQKIPFKIYIDEEHNYFIEGGGDDIGIPIELKGEKVSNISKLLKGAKEFRRTAIDQPERNILESAVDKKIIITPLYTPQSTSRLCDFIIENCRGSKENE